MATDPTDTDADDRSERTASDGSTLESAEDAKAEVTRSERETLEASRKSGAETAPTGVTREGRIYVEDDPRRSGDEDPNLDDKTQVDLSDTAPDGTALRPGLVDIDGNALVRSQDLGGSLPGGMAVPGADRLSGMMDPLGTAESDPAGGALGGLGGGVDPRLAAGGGHQDLVDAAKRLAAEYHQTAEDVAAQAAANLVHTAATLAETSLAARAVEGTAIILDQVTGKTRADDTPTPMPGGTTPAPAAPDEQKAAAEKAAAEKAAAEKAAAEKAAAEKAEAEKAEAEKAAADDEEKEEEVPLRPENMGGDLPLTREQIDSALRHREPGYVDPAEEAGTQAVLVEGQGGYQFRPHRGLWDPVAPEDQPLGGAQSGDPLNRDPGYIDPAETDEGTGGLPVGGTDPLTGGRVDGVPEQGSPAPTTDPTAAQGGPAEAGLSAPGAPPAGGGEVAVDPTEDEPQYGVAGGPEATPQPDLSGANLQGTVVGAAEPSGTPAGPALEWPATDTASPQAGEDSEPVPDESGDDGLP